jgi:hypothetical protein
MRYTLDDPREKLRWARQHFETLRPQIEAFEQRDAHTISVEVNADAGEYVFHVHNVEEPDPDWGLMIGDCIHNARAALDYLMVQLYAWITESDPRETTGVQFPISHDPDRFRSSPSVVEAGKHFHFSGYLARLEELQPYNSLNVSVWGSPKINGSASYLAAGLQNLSRLDIIDKHRVVHAIWAGLSLLSLGTEKPWPSEFKSISGSLSAGKPLQEDAQIASWRFETPLPFEWEPSQVEMKRMFPVEIGFDQRWIGVGQSVLVVLPLCLWTVEAIIGLFEPVFDLKEPPLPVSSIEAPALRSF